MDLKLIFWITCRVGIISDILSQSDREGN